MVNPFLMPSPLSLSSHRRRRRLYSYLHIKYTARDGNSDLKIAADALLTSQLNAIAQNLGESGLHLALSMKHDLSKEWHLLKKDGSITLTLDKSRLPYMVQSFNTILIDSVMFIAKVKDNPASFTINVGNVATDLEWMDELKLCKGVNLDIDLDTSFTLSVSNADKLKLEELMLVVKYKF